MFQLNIYPDKTEKVYRYRGTAIFYFLMKYEKVFLWNIDGRNTIYGVIT